MDNSLRTKRFFRFGSFRLYPDTRVLLRDADIVPLPPKAADTLLALLRSAGQPVEKDALIRELWPDTFVEDNNLAHHISVLRRTLAKSETGAAYIETIPKRGYRFVGEVKEEVEGTGHIPGVSPGKPSETVTHLRLRRAKLAIAITLLVVAAFVGSSAAHRVATPAVGSLAVLPFQNLSGDSQEYVADGLTEALIGELSKIGQLRIISRTSVMRYKDGKEPLSDVARALNVAAVVDGSVARFGNNVRVSVQLVDGASDRHLWEETYERDFGEIPKLWNEIASAIAREIRVQAQAGSTRLAQQPVNRAAFEAYLRGRYYWNKRTPENIRRAIDHFRKAIDEDPAYARGYAGLADCYNQLGTVLIGGERPKLIRPVAIAAAKKALEIDPELAEAHAALAYGRLYDWQWAAAEQGFQRAIQLNPSYAPAHLWYAHYLSMRKRHGEALREVRLAEELDPLSPIIRTQVGWILQHAGRYDEAIQQFRKVLESEPDYLWALWRVGSSYASRSMFSEAIRALERAAALSQRSPSILGTLAETYGLAGRRPEAQKILDELQSLSRRQYVPAIAFAHAYIGIGASDLVLESLERAYENREQGVAWLAIWEDHGTYGSDPRFRELIRRVGLPDS